MTDNSELGSGSLLLRCKKCGELNIGIHVFNCCAKCIAKEAYGELNDNELEVSNNKYGIIFRMKLQLTLITT